MPKPLGTTGAKPPMFTAELLSVLVDRMLWFICPYAGSRNSSGRAIPLAAARYRRANKCRSKPWPVKRQNKKPKSQNLRTERDLSRTPYPTHVGVPHTASLRMEEGSVYVCIHTSSSLTSGAVHSRILP